MGQGFDHPDATVAPNDIEFVIAVHDAAGPLPVSRSSTSVPTGNFLVGAWLVLGQAKGPWPPHHPVFFKQAIPPPLNVETGRSQRGIVPATFIPCSEQGPLQHLERLGKC